MSATKEQHMEALERANEIRIQRAGLKRSIRAGDVKVTEILSEPIPSWLRAEPIGRFLKCIPRLGETRTTTVLRSIPLDYWRTVGNLTAREKAGLIIRLRERKGIKA